ncbi:hypothetical protein [Candidatus Poriferisodalis sp.]|uniref:hypothetical protein n=1 Tax=Candidatus Poriferisodalis sp. TaxID=3101277 RepID=UPI003C6EFE66
MSDRSETGAMPALRIAVVRCGRAGRPVPSSGRIVSPSTDGRRRRGADAGPRTQPRADEMATEIVEER